MRKLKCYKCGHSFDVPYEYVGHSVVCKVCDTLNPVPGSDTKADSWFAAMRAKSQDVLEQNFDRLFQSLLEHERRAPALQT